MTRRDQSDRSAAQFIPDRPTLAALRDAARTCTGCDLYQRATQTVFGEGASHAKIVFIGEQPGDQEDVAGHPFVGPAGRILDKALTEAGITRADVYVTNAVKHFKWEPQGKRRKHKRPSAAEVAACRPWLMAELDVVRPAVVVCLGVTAAQSMLGRTVRLNETRSRFLPSVTPVETFVTIHPSSILRHPERAQQQAEYERFVADLKMVAQRLQQRNPAGEPCRRM